MSSKRLKITNAQIDKRIAQYKRMLEMRSAREVVAGRQTQADVDQRQAEFDANYRGDKLGVGSAIEWDDDMYQIVEVVADGVIVSKISINTRR